MTTVLADVRVVAGAGALARAHDADPRWSSAVVLLDAGLARLPDGADRRAFLSDVMPRAEVVEVDTSGVTADDLPALARVIDGRPACVAVGGGSLLDAVKLATLRGPSRFDLERVLVTGRSGLVALSPRVHRSCGLLLAPTTTGTASESSRVATVVTSRGKRLVHSPALLGDVAVLDPVLTRGLPTQALRLGLLEALLRVLGPFAAAAEPGADPAAGEALAAALLVDVGRLLVDADRIEGSASDALRLAAATVSARTQQTGLTSSREPFGWRLWFLANELSQVLRVPKMTATLTLLPGYWRSVQRGDERLGRAEQLARGWALVRQGTAGRLDLPDDPAGAVRWLVARWELPTVAVPPGAAAQVADAVARAWGRGLPMLAPLQEEDLHELYRTWPAVWTQVAGNAVQKHSGVPAHYHVLAPRTPLPEESKNLADFSPRMLRSSR